MSNIDKQTTTTQDNTNNKKFTSKPFLFGLTWELYMLNGGNNLKTTKNNKNEFIVQCKFVLSYWLFYLHTY